MQSNPKGINTEKFNKLPEDKKKEIYKSIENSRTSRTIKSIQQLNKKEENKLCMGYLEEVKKDHVWAELNIDSITRYVIDVFGYVVEKTPGIYLARIAYAFKSPKDKYNEKIAKRIYAKRLYFEDNKFYYEVQINSSTAKCKERLECFLHTFTEYQIATSSNDFWAKLKCLYI
jgi:hypothetical protein